MFWRDLWRVKPVYPFEASEKATMKACEFDVVEVGGGWSEGGRRRKRDGTSEIHSFNGMLRDVSLGLGVYE